MGKSIENIEKNRVQVRDAFLPDFAKLIAYDLRKTNHCVSIIVHMGGQMARINMSPEDWEALKEAI